MTRPSSRRTLAAGARLPQVRPPAAPDTDAGPDAELLALCREYLALLAYESTMLNGALAGSEAEEDAIAAHLAPNDQRQAEIVHNLVALPTRSLAGFHARAHALECFNADDNTKCSAGLLASEYHDDLMLGALLRDLLAVPRGAAQ